MLFLQIVLKSMQVDEVLKMPSGPVHPEGSFALRAKSMLGN